MTALHGHIPPNVYAVGIYFLLVLFALACWRGVL
jgi:hypothetical protein